ASVQRYLVSAVSVGRAATPGPHERRTSRAFANSGPRGRNPSVTGDRQGRREPLRPRRHSPPPKDRRTDVHRSSPRALPARRFTRYAALGVTAGLAAAL